MVFDFFDVEKTGEIGPEDFKEALKEWCPDTYEEMVQ